MHFAPERIKGAKIARTVGVDRDRFVAQFEQPGLCIVRVGGEDRGAQRLLQPVDDAAASFAPGRIRCSLRS
jgi:hypothetical protein